MPAWRWLFEFSRASFESCVHSIYFTFQFLFIYQVNNIPDPNIIIFEMTKDDRKDFYRTIGKNNCQLF